MYFFIVLFISDAEQLHYCYGLLLGYLVGSFPTAYLLVKRKARLDIRRIGSGNVGAMNTFDVTGSKALSIAVLLVDMLKGVLAVWLSSMIMSGDSWGTGLCGAASVVGHNYSPWLGFKGGRGLATSLGVALSLGWIVVAVWSALWGISYVISKQIHLSNILASVFGPAILVLTPDNLVWRTLPPYTGVTECRYVAGMLCVLILLRHVDCLGELKKSFNNHSSSSTWNNSR